MSHESLNPFDNPAFAFFVLINDEEQYSLWPDIRPAPTGWRVIMGPENRESCENYIETHWTDIRPSSARKAFA
jgi:MbtH protein